MFALGRPSTTTRHACAVGCSVEQSSDREALWISRTETESKVPLCQGANHQHQGTDQMQSGGYQVQVVRQSSWSKLGALVQQAGYMQRGVQ